MVTVICLIAIAIGAMACGRQPDPVPPTAVVPTAPAVVPPSPPAATVPPTSLSMRATGLGPCHEPWYITCNYGIRIEGPGGSDRRGSFAWDEGPRPEGQLGHGSAGPVGSTGLGGDAPASLGPGTWTISFRLWHGSDVVSLAPVPGGTPRDSAEDPFTAACSTTIDTTAIASVTLLVAFDGAACSVVTEVIRR